MIRLDYRVDFFRMVDSGAASHFLDGIGLPVKCH